MDMYDPRNLVVGLINERWEETLFLPIGVAIFLVGLEVVP